MVNQYCVHSFARNWQFPFLNQLKGENDRRKYLMINLHERMLPTLAGVEPVTSWSPVGRRIQGRFKVTYTRCMLSKMSRRNTMQVLKVLVIMVEEIARVNEIDDGRMHARTENQTPMSHHANRCDKNIWCRCALDAPHWNASNEYPQHVFMKKWKTRAGVCKTLCPKLPYFNTACPWQ